MGAKKPWRAATSRATIEMMRGVAVLAAMAVAGCSAAHAPASAATEFLDGLRRALCDRDVRCAGAFDSPPGPRHYRTAPYCHADARVFGWDGADETVALGRAAFDADAASRCLAEIAALPCRSDHSPTSTTPSCGSVFRSLVPVGGRCAPTSFFVSGCASAAYCARSDACDGTCVPAAPDGATCDTRPCATTYCGFPAAPHAYCGPLPALGQACTTVCVPDTAVCRAGVCVAAPVGAAGDACGIGVGSCAIGLICGWSDSALDQPTCRTPPPPGGAGAPCEPGACASGLDCILGRCGAPSRTSREGDACASHYDCAQPLFCVRGRCTASPPPGCFDNATPSQWPVAVDPPAYCPPGMRCSFADGYCFTAVALGEACNARTQCADGSRCVGGTCVAAAHPGDPCTTDLICPSGFACVASRCIPLPSLGEPCTDRCIDSACIAGTCARRPDGASCGDEPGPYRGAIELAYCQGLCSPADRTCVPALAAGESCRWNSWHRCADGLRCIGDANDHGVCAPRTCGR